MQIIFYNFIFYLFSMLFFSTLTCIDQDLIKEYKYFENSIKNIPEVEKFEIIKCTNFNQNSVEINALLVLKNDENSKLIIDTIALTPLVKNIPMIQQKFDIDKSEFNLKIILLKNTLLNKLQDFLSKKTKYSLLFAYATSRIFSSKSIPVLIFRILKLFYLTKNMLNNKRDTTWSRACLYYGLLNFKLIKTNDIYSRVVENGSSFESRIVKQKVYDL